MEDPFFFPFEGLFLLSVYGFFLSACMLVHRVHAVSMEAMEASALLRGEFRQFVSCRVGVGIKYRSPEELLVEPSLQPLGEHFKKEVIIIVWTRSKVAHLETTVELETVNKVRYVKRNTSSIKHGEGEKGKNQHLAIMILM